MWLVDYENEAMIVTAFHDTLTTILQLKSSDDLEEACKEVKYSKFHKIFYPTLSIIGPCWLFDTYFLTFLPPKPQIFIGVYYPKLKILEISYFPQRAERAGGY